MQPSGLEAPLDRNANRQGRAEHPWKVCNGPGLPLEAALCLHPPAEMQSATSKARRDGLKGRQGSDSREKAENENGEAVTPEIWVTGTLGENLDSCLEMFHDKEHILKILGMR